MAFYRFLSIWQAKRAADFYVNWHTHNCYELVYYTNGNGQTTLAESRFPFAGSTFALVPCGVPHDETHFENGGVICLTFLWEHRLPAGVYPDTDLAILHILQRMLQELNKQDTDFEEMLTLKLGELVILLNRRQNRKTEHKNLDYIINLLRTQFHQNIRLSDCAKQINLSYDYFQHKFKAQTGCSPQQFLIEQRLCAAEQMLKNEDTSCTQIAYRCGFSTSAQFSGMFKKRFGVSPLQYKRQMK